MSEFSLLGFIEHLALIGTEIVLAEHEGLEQAAQLIEGEAKQSVGTYQQASGPFAAWAPLAQATMDDRVAQGFPADEPELRTGQHTRDSIEHVVHGREADIGSNDEVMELQELGTSKMPPRSILGGAAARKSDEVAELIGEHAYAALTGGSVSPLRIR